MKLFQAITSRKYDIKRHNYWELKYIRWSRSLGYSRIIYYILWQNLIISSLRWTCKLRHMQVSKTGMTPGNIYFFILAWSHIRFTLSIFTTIIVSWVWNENVKIICPRSWTFSSTIPLGIIFFHVQLNVSIDVRLQ